jgi:hypothetical protein
MGDDKGVMTSISDLSDNDNFLCDSILLMPVHSSSGSNVHDESFVRHDGLFLALPLPPPPSPPSIGRPASLAGDSTADPTPPPALATMASSYLQHGVQSMPSNASPRRCGNDAMSRNCGVLLFEKPAHNATRRSFPREGETKRGKKDVTKI